MVVASNVKTKIDNVISRSDLQTTVVINTYGTIENDFGEYERDYITQTTTNGIPLDYRTYSKKYDRNGDFDNASYILYVSASESVTKQDIIEMYNDDYIITGIKEFPLNNIIVAKLLFVAKQEED